MKKGSVRNILIVIAIGFYLVSAIMLYKGYDKMTNYYNSTTDYRYSDYAISRNVNAYVGGDAYNYIINSNYSTGFFVLSMGFMIAGTICISGGLISGLIPKNDIPEKVSCEDHDHL